jgi:drug/metabolite transporter (DMT)-like permease
MRLSTILHSPLLRRQAPLALAAVAGAGFLGGAAYVILGRPARRVPAVGPYLAGVITIAAYMGALLLASPFISDEPLVKQRSNLVIFAVVTLFFGLLAGHSWFREKNSSTVR